MSIFSSYPGSRVHILFSCERSGVMARIYADLDDWLFADEEVGPSER